MVVVESLKQALEGVYRPLVRIRKKVIEISLAFVT
jgi:hypothetical protein